MPAGADLGALHPFGQIPTYEEGDLCLLETGAIVLHIAARLLCRPFSLCHVEGRQGCWGGPKTAPHNALVPLD